MDGALVVLLVATLGIWVLLGIACTLRIIGRMAGDNPQVLLLILILTHFVGLGFLMVGGFIWATWIMVSFPFKVVAEERRNPARDAASKIVPLGSAHHPDCVCVGCSNFGPECFPPDGLNPADRAFMRSN